MILIMDSKTNNAIKFMISTLYSFEHHLNTIKENPEDFEELNDLLLELRFISIFDLISHFKEALKHVIGENS